MEPSSSPGWRPIHDNHAIAVMAAVISYAEPLPSKILAKALADAEPSIFEAGLQSRHFTHGQAVEVSVQPDGSPPQIKMGAAPVMGRSYNAAVNSDAGEPTSRIAEQVQINASSIIYRTWNYVSWEWQFTRLSALLKPALSTALSVVSVGSVRLEYMDRFFFEGDRASADPNALLRPASPLVAPHVYQARDHWHSHTGAFVGEISPDQLLLQVTVDSVDQPGRDERPVRWVNIMTAFERRMKESDEGMATDPTASLTVLDDLHEPLKSKLAEIISDEMAARIFLRG